MANVLERAQALGIRYADGMSEIEWESSIFGEKGQEGQCRLTDYEHFHREMAKAV